MKEKSNSNGTAQRLYECRLGAPNCISLQTTRYQLIAKVGNCRIDERPHVATQETPRIVLES